MKVVSVKLVQIFGSGVAEASAAFGGHLIQLAGTGGEAVHGRVVRFSGWNDRSNRIRLLTMASGFEGRDAPFLERALKTIEMAVKMAPASSAEPERHKAIYGFVATWQRLLRS
jgi:hypothetical protein